MKIPGLHDKHCDGVMLSIYPVFFNLLGLFVSFHVVIPQFRATCADLNWPTPLPTTCKHIR
jgi:hypothetical protein